MLTADLLPVRRKNGVLTLPPIEGKSRQLHLELAEQVVALVADCVGMTREQLGLELSTITQSPHESRIIKGYAKIIEDSVEFEQDRGHGAQAKREALFERSARVWQGLAEGQFFERDAVLKDVAGELGLLPSDLDDELFVDLPSAQRVTSTVTLTAEGLVERYDAERVMALLLRAVKVTAKFSVSSPAQVRELFRVLKFRRLMFELKRSDSERFELVLTGPYSLFDAVTKYGLQLALVWPVLREQSQLEMTCELKWGKTNEKCVYHWAKRKEAICSTDRGVDEPAGGAELASELVEVKEALEQALAGVRIEPAVTMLDLPGVGLCVPDLTCHYEDGRVVHVELLGYWSRAAVFRRVELVEAGLVEPVVFLVSSRLRVKEEVLDDKANGALYVFRGRINVATLAGKISALAERAPGRSPGAKARRRK